MPPPAFVGNVRLTGADRPGQGAVALAGCRTAFARYGGGGSCAPPLRCAYGLIRRRERCGVARCRLRAERVTAGASTDCAPPPRLPLVAAAGVIRALTNVLYRHGLNIESLQTDQHYVPSGTAPAEAPGTDSAPGAGSDYICMFHTNGVVSGEAVPDMRRLQKDLRVLQQELGVLCEVVQRSSGNLQRRVRRRITTSKK